MSLLFTIGNLSAGDTLYGVEAEQEFGSLDVYGPYRENEANTLAHSLVETKDVNGKRVPSRYISVKVVRIELPQAGKRIVRSSGSGVNDSGYEYAV